MYNQRLNKGHSYTKYIKNEIELNELRLTYIWVLREYIGLVHVYI